MRRLPDPAEALRGARQLLLTHACKSATNQVAYSVPGLSKRDAVEVIRLLQDRLNSLNDLALTLKHVHWNVVVPPAPRQPDARPRAEIPEGY
jgi:hypothetical protein